MHNVYDNGIKKKEYINVYQWLEIYTYCSTKKAVCGRGTKTEKSLLE